MPLKPIEMNTSPTMYAESVAEEATMMKPMVYRQRTKVKVLGRPARSEILAKTRNALVSRMSEERELLYDLQGLQTAAMISVAIARAARPLECCEKLQKRVSLLELN